MFRFPTPIFGLLAPLLRSCMAPLFKGSASKPQTLPAHHSVRRTPLLIPRAVCQTVPGVSAKRPLYPGHGSEKLPVMFLRVEDVFRVFRT